jgi:N-acetylmuramoyl-L-alanine amidase
VRVVFDIGHGANTWPPSKGVNNPDGTSFAEHDFNSAVAIKAKELAEKQGFEILFSQQPYAADVKVSKRCDWINSEHKKKPILCVVSFHANASGDKTATGWGVFHWHNSSKGKQLAELWSKYAKSLLPLKPWGTGVWKCEPGTWTNFELVRKTAMPCILAEHFFFTNFSELRKCNTPEFIEKAAEVTVRALVEFAGMKYKEPQISGIVKPKSGAGEYEQAIDILGKEFGIGVAYWKQKQDIDIYFAELMIKIASRYGDIKKAEAAKYYIEGTTHVIELDPMMLRAKQVGKIDTFNGVNANFFDTSTGKPITIGWLASEGKILKDREQHKKWGGLYDYPKGTLIVFKDGTVQVGLMTDGQMDSIRDNIYFCCQGFNLFPLDTAKEGYNLAEVGRTSNRVSIGYRKLDNKIILAVRPDSDAHMARTTMTNLGCNGHAICLDSGGSTNLRVKGKDIFKTSRTLSNIIYW